MSDNQLSEQIQKLAEHLKFIERKLDQLIEASERQPASNESPRREFQQRPGGFRPNGYGQGQGGGYRPNGGQGGYRPQRPGYGQGGGRPYENRGGEGRPSYGGGERGERPSSGGQGQGGGFKKPFHAKFSSKNRNRNDR